MHLDSMRTDEFAILMYLHEHAAVAGHRVDESIKMATSSNSDCVLPSQLSTNQSLSKARNIHAFAYGLESANRTD